MRAHPWSDGHAAGRIAVIASAVGVGALQVFVPGLASAAPAPPPPSATNAPPPAPQSAPPKPAPPKPAPPKPAPPKPAPHPAAHPPAHPPRGSKAPNHRRPAPPPPLPCRPTAKACVDISAKKAWLTDGHGHVTRGPVPITTGGPGQETPVGVFKVLWKDKDHLSKQFHNAPMPNSVFFAPGDAFHGGSLKRSSAGCVHLSPADSVAFFDYLQVNDEVQVVP